MRIIIVAIRVAMAATYAAIQDRLNILVVWGDDISANTSGFDDFFRNLYHLKAEEEPEN